jgi:hypothetical protein
MRSTDPPPQPPGPRAKLISWRPLCRNTLRGFVSVRFASGLEIYQIPVHISGDRAWASPPARPRIDHNGTATRDHPAGKIKYQAVIGFASPATRLRWSRAVIEALLSEIPHALDADDNATEWALAIADDPWLS